MPNPNNGTFSITGIFTSKISKEVSIAITDMLGKVVYRNVAYITNGSINKGITLDSGIANGIYLIRVQSEDETRVLRVSLSR